jgi:transcription elongation factor Elf1
VTIPTCVECGSTTFQNTAVSPQSNFELTFVHCSSCGAVVGVMDFYNIGQKIKDLAKALRVKSSDL